MAPPRLLAPSLWALPVSCAKHVASTGGQKSPSHRGAFAIFSHHKTSVSLQRYIRFEITNTTYNTIDINHEIAEMASIVNLPAEVHLHILEAVTDLNDLNNLLRSSERLREVFAANFRGLLKATIIPRIFPGNTSAVEEALQAACSNQMMRCLCHSKQAWSSRIPGG